MPDRNVIGILPGSDPELKHEAMVFTAHFDHVGIGKAVAGDSIYNGATDNASGTSGLLALAEAFGNLPAQPKRSLLFMALTGEERGLLGAYYYTENPIVDLKNTVACINLDMIGIGDDSGIIAYGGERSSLGEIMEAALEQVGLTSMPDPVPEERIFQRSDHYAFAEKGVPSILTGYGVDREAFERHLKYYHQPGDDASRPFDYEYIQHHIAAVVLAGWQIANAPDPPSWTKGDPLSRVRTETE
jgi:Zn-dependent M28 family amino/carboxypeptidase